MKQFLELAAGVVVGIIFYVTGLPAIIKWPLILFSGGLGAALAFVPFEERPLERWIFAFFRSVYSPTLFHWEKQQVVKYFQDESQNVIDATIGKPAPFAKIPFLAKLEDSENSYLKKLAEIFVPSSAAPQTPQPVIQQTVPSPVNQESSSPAGSSAPQVIANTQPTNMVTASMVPSQDGQILTLRQAQGKQSVEETIPQEPIKRDVVVPQTTYISLTRNTRPQMTVQEIPQSQEKVDLTPTAIFPALKGEAVQNAQVAQFSAQAAPPSLPTIINTVSGQVMDAKGNIIEGAILEIKDVSGRPIRALKSNNAGHFLIVTALADGKYDILVEKEGFTFEPVSFEAIGGIIQPIAIRAKA